MAVVCLDCELPSPAPRETGSRAGHRTLTYIALLVVAVGVVWRLGRYLLQFPIWGDEAFICLNLPDGRYLSLIQPLRFNQVAPLLFLWGELSVYRMLGGSELALRLLPLLTGLVSLGLFWRLAWQTLSPRAAALAVSILAVSYYPVRHSCEVKPYAFDLCVALILLVLAVSWLREPHRPGGLLLLTCFAPIALALSYPAVLIAGAISLTFLAPVLRQPGWKIKGLYIAYNALVIFTFSLIWRLTGTGQHAAMDKVYWQNWFPPSEPLALIRWVVQVHTGNLMAYPLGGRGGASTGTFVLCLVGVWQLVRARQRSLLLLWMLPFGLTLIAAAAHKYPYGGSARVAQHLAPAICLLAANGFTGLLQRTRWVVLACVPMALLGLVGLARDVAKPYKSDDDQFVRQFVYQVAERASLADQIVVMDREDVGPTFEWYLRRQGERICWNGQVHRQRLEGACDLWCLYFAPNQELFADPSMELVEHSKRLLQLGADQDRPEYCEMRRYERKRPGEPGTPY
jgi:hypothetical protein